jgi:hypothetical protein
MVLINHIFFNRKIVKMMKEMMRERERRRQMEADMPIDPYRQL